MGVSLGIKSTGYQIDILCKMNLRALEEVLLLLFETSPIVCEIPCWDLLVVASLEVNGG